MPADDPARRTAIDVVLAVDADGAYANLLLARLRRERRLIPRDAAFAVELTFGTLRWQGVLDEVIAAAARRPVDELDPPVRAVLRVGAYQLLHLRTPPHAAVHATVELARSIAGPKPVGFVNAVLRKISQADWDTWAGRLAPPDERGALAFRSGYPRWIADAIAAALGDETELPAALAADRAVTHLVARPGRMSRDDLLAEAGEGAEPGEFSPYAVRLAAGGDPGALASVRSGDAAVQDEGSQLVALAIARADVGVDRGRWLDLCAGPGGKAALSQGLLPEGGRLLAADLHPHRARLVASALVTGVPGTGHVVVADGTAPAWPAGAFDRALVDVPCTGLGALRRRPEVRWRRQPEDVERLRPLQESLLEAALDAVRPGGVVGYVTCSPVPAETTGVVAAVLSRRPGVSVVDPRPLLAEVPDAVTATHVQLWPHRQGTDAMFLSVFRRDC